MNAPNFSAVLEAFDEIRAERLDAIAEAQAEVRIAERRLAAAESSADMRTWTWEEREEWESAHFAVREAYDNLRKARQAL